MADLATSSLFKIPENNHSIDKLNSKTTSALASAEPLDVQPLAKLHILKSNGDMREVTRHSQVNLEKVEKVNGDQQISFELDLAESNRNIYLDPVAPFLTRRFSSSGFSCFFELFWQLSDRHVLRKPPRPTSF